MILLIFRWCPNTIWKQGALVRSDNEIYRARSDVNSAEPGSIHHERFYVIIKLGFNIKIVLIRYL